MRKDKCDSVFYDGEIATGIGKDGKTYILEAVGEVSAFIDNEWFPDFRDAIAKFDLTDKKIYDMSEAGRFEFKNNNWFQVVTPDGSYESDVMEDYESAISELEDTINGERDD